MIENVIFDLSEVLISGLIGVEKPLSARLGRSEHLIASAMGSHPFYRVGNQLDRLCVGEIDFARYLDIIHAELGLAERQDELIIRAFHDFFDIKYAYTDALLESLRGRYRLFLHSDHCREWIGYIRTRHPFLVLFDRQFYSFDLGSTKREVKSFQRVIHLSGVDPAKTLFIDDNPNNVANAELAGMSGIHFRGAASLPLIEKALIS